MNLPSIGLVGSQLHQIYELSPKELISNYFGDYLYPKSSWMGRLWTWFYKLHDSYFTPGLEQKNLQCAVNHVYQSFERHLRRIKPYETLYSDHIKGKKIVFSELATARRELFQFYQATPDCYHPLYLPMIEVESLTKTPFPAPLIKKFTKFTLDTDEKREFNFWIKTVNRSHVPIKCLHAALGLVVENLPEAEIMLEAHGLKIGTLKDPQHLAWRDALKEGDNVRCNGKIVTLGKRLDEKSDFDHRVYFEIEEGLLLIGINHAVPGMVRETNLKAWGVEPAAILEVDKEGKCAIVERLAAPVKTLKWSSNSADITEKDRVQALPLINWFRWLKDEEFVPDKFDPKFFMLDEKGTLRCTRAMQRKPYTGLESLEEFIRDMTCHHYHISNYFYRRLLG